MSEVSEWGCVIVQSLLWHGLCHGVSCGLSNCMMLGKPTTTCAVLTMGSIMPSFHGGWNSCQNTAGKDAIIILRFTAVGIVNQNTAGRPGPRRSSTVALLSLYVILPHWHPPICHDKVFHQATRASRREKTSQLNQSYTASHRSEQKQVLPWEMGWLVRERQALLSCAPQAEVHFL